MTYYTSSGQDTTPVLAFSSAELLEKAMERYQSRNGYYIAMVANHVGQSSIA